MAKDTRPLLSSKRHMRWRGVLPGVLLPSLHYCSLFLYTQLSCSLASASVPGIEYDYGISPKFVCTPIPPEADPSCFSPPAVPHGPGSNGHGNGHGSNGHHGPSGGSPNGGSRRGMMSDEAKSTILHLRESLVRQKETILDQRETIRELTAKLTLCEGFGRGGDHHGPPTHHPSSHHPSSSHHTYHGNDHHSDPHYPHNSHRPDPHHRGKGSSYSGGSKHGSFSSEQTGKTLHSLKERLENLQARNSSSSYSSSLRDLLQRKIKALEDQLSHSGGHRNHGHHDDHHDNHHGTGTGHHDEHPDDHHDDNHGNGHHDDLHGNHHDDHHDDRHNNYHDNHHDDHHDDHPIDHRNRHGSHYNNHHYDRHNSHHDGHYYDHRYDRHYDRGNVRHNTHHDDHHANHHDDHHDDHHENHHDDHHDDHHNPGHHDDHHNPGHHDDHHNPGHHDDHHGDPHEDHHDNGHHSSNGDNSHHPRPPFVGKQPVPRPPPPAHGSGHAKLDSVLSHLPHRTPEPAPRKKPMSPDAFQIGFPMRTNYMYGKIKKPLVNELFSLTVCLWLKGGSGPGLGTPFSYSVAGQANELVLIEWGNNPMELLVNDKAVTLPMSLTDGKWHHVCVTWATRDGHWEAYQDGVKRGSGENLSPWHAIKPGGVFILGQEQDTVGGRFDATQSFVGEMSDLQFWSRVLTPNEIYSQASCSVHLSGDVMSWTEAAVELHGGVTKYPFDPCHH